MCMHAVCTWNRASKLKSNVNAIPLLEDYSSQRWIDQPLQQSVQRSSQVRTNTPMAISSGGNGGMGREAGMVL